MTEILESLISDSLKPLGFKRKGKSWRRVYSTLYSLFNIQSSEWGGGFYLNFGFAPVEILKNNWLPISKCLVQFRIENLTAMNSTVFHAMDEIASRNKNTEEVNLFYGERIIPLVVQTFEMVHDWSSLKLFLTSNTLGRALIFSSAREYLKMDRNA